MAHKQIHPAAAPLVDTRIIRASTPGHLPWPIDQPVNQAVILLTTFRTQGATTATAAKATGHVVMQLLIHCAGNPECTPCEIAITKAETMLTMIAESNALKMIGANRAGIRIGFSQV